VIASGASPVLQSVPIRLIDEPDLPMRQSFDPTAMEELVASIRAHGVIQSLALVQNGERYRVAAGHRRAIAARIAGLKEVPAAVYPENTPLEEILKVEENNRRERVNPADEALYYAKLLEERCGNDVFNLCALVGQKQSYVEGRLNLITGYEEVFRALQNRKINLAVAVELNKYKDHGFMLVDLETAIETGASSRYLARMRTEREKLFARYPQPEPSADQALSYQAPPPLAQVCCVCGEGHDPWNLDPLLVHRGGPCKKILERALGPGAAGVE
jgi:ParB/RepB/Spo0J family partition protein